MRNKGFTLIELLGVIIILALLMILTFPSIINSIKSTSNKKDKLVLDLVYNATDMFIKDNKNIYLAEEGNSYCITLTELIEHGDLKGPVIISDEDITDKKSVQVTYSNKFNYELKNNNNCRTKIQPNKPDLLNNSLVPVKYNGSNWVVVDGSKIDWYDYDNQEWANGVILNSGVSKNIGDTVNIEDEVKAIFVWIPRYEYKIEGSYGKGGTSATSPGEIEVKFVYSTRTSPSEGYIMHPAFTFGDEELTGIWVGKFETSPQINSSCYSNNNETNCNNINQEIYIIPNRRSLTSQSVENQFLTSQKFNSYLTQGDSHMMKNSEWGAVAYLSQSKYGKYGNSMYSSTNKEIYHNNDGITGKSSGVVSGGTTNCFYNDINDRGNGTGSCGGGASTTGNITGVYDMNGGLWEYVMGYLTTASSTWGSSSNQVYYSGFKTIIPEAKYFDEYINTSLTLACNSGVCYGQALSETLGWYEDEATNLSSIGPWYRRGSSLTYSNSITGIFSFKGTSGGSSDSTTFRVVVSPK